MISASRKVWFREDSNCNWLKGEVRDVSELAPLALKGGDKIAKKQCTRVEFKIELQDDEGELLGEMFTLVSSPIDGSLEEYEFVKPRNEVDDDPDGADAVDDLISIQHLHEPAILSCLEKRFRRNIVYTNTGPILIAVVSNTCKC